MNRISLLRKRAGMSQAELGRIIGVAQNTVSAWEKCVREPDNDTLRKLADYFGVTVDCILGREEGDLVPPMMDRAVVDVNVYGRIPAGVPVEAIEEIIDTEQIPAAMLAGGHEYFALSVRGDSMYPVYLDGDIVIIKKQETCETGDDCVVYINGYDATLKRVKLYEDGSVELCPLNTNYAPRRYSAEEASSLPVQIGGVVVELRRKIK